MIQEKNRLFGVIKNKNNKNWKVFEAAIISFLIPIIESWEVLISSF